MNINDYHSLMKARQSCRNFDFSKTPQKDDLVKILEIAKLSPSACNSQPYAVYITTGDIAKEIQNTKVAGFNAFIDECNTFFIITEATYTLPSKIGSVMRNVDFRAVDIGIFTANIVNAAKIIGIETCILGMFNEKKIKKIIGTSHRIKLVIALGYPSAEYKTEEKKRKPFDTHIHFLT